MKCEISCCSRAAVVLVWFTYSLRPHPFCKWHAYDKKGELRWRPRDIAQTSAPKGIQ